MEYRYSNKLNRKQGAEGIRVEIEKPLGKDKVRLMVKCVVRDLLDEGFARIGSK